MKFWPEIHWAEGLFLRPHHLQAAARQAQTLAGSSLEALHPFAWGFRSIDLALDALENYRLEIRGAELRLADGALLKIPENCDLPPRDFKKELEAATTGLTVYLALPRFETVRANVLNADDDLKSRRARFRVDVVERYDENTGDNPQPISVRRQQAAFLLENEDRTGFECVRLGRIERTPAGAKLAPANVPPLLRLRAWPSLLTQIEVLYNDVRARVEQLGADASTRALTFATGAPADVEQLMKLAALNELGVQLGIVATCPDLHPYELYRTLIGGIGRVALWDGARRPRELPAYDHENSGPIFDELIRYLRALINGMLPRDYVERPFEVRDGGLGVELDAEWFTPAHEMYLGIRSQLNVDDVMALFRTINFKLASPRDAVEVYQRRLSGLEFKPVTSVANLPRSADQHYFRISRSAPYWEHCERERGIFIRMPQQDMPKLDPLRVALFVIKLR
ncbi:MAG: type VI secretion system baseplate subunit TssK [Phycisphaerae bacterium]|nr:type VI secretion system baseplate subunit TssK [Phycisphaerae bacterium]